MVSRVEAQLSYRSLQARFKSGYSVLVVGPAFDTGAAPVATGTDTVYAVRSTAELAALYPAADPADPDSGVLHLAYMALPPAAILADENPVLVVVTDGTDGAAYAAALAAATGDPRVRWLVTVDPAVATQIATYVTDSAAAGVNVIPVTTLPGITGATPAQHLDNYVLDSAARPYVEIPVWPADPIWDGNAVSGQILAADIAGQLSWSAPQQDPRQVDVRPNWTSADIVAGYVGPLSLLDPVYPGVYALRERTGVGVDVTATGTNTINTAGDSLVTLQTIRDVVRRLIVERLDQADTRSRIAAAAGTEGAVARNLVLDFLAELQPAFVASGVRAYTGFAVPSVSYASGELSLTALLTVSIGYTSAAITVVAEVQ